MPRHLPNLTYIRQFITVAEQGSISEAARSLNITQPALSKSLRKLEQTVGTPLVERFATGIRLTSAGQMFLNHAQVIALEYEHALQNIRNVIEDQDSTVNILAGPIWSNTVVPAVLPQFHRLFPRIRLNVKSVGARGVAEDLLMGKAEIFAGALLDHEIPGELEVQRVVKSGLGVLASNAHPLAGRAHVSARDLANFPFVIYAPSSEIYDYLAAFQYRHQAPLPKVVLETSSLQSCLEIVKKGELLLFETTMIANSAYGSGIVPLRIGEVLNPYDVGLVYRPALKKIAHNNRLLRIMRSAMLDFVQP